MNFTWFVVVALYFGLTHLIANFIGIHRQIGYGKSVYWCIVLSPVIGLLIVLSSPRSAAAKLVVS